MQSFEEIIQFAIRHEEEEAAFYESLAGRSVGEDQKKALLEHADEERNHKRMLEDILAKQRIPLSTAQYMAPADMNFKSYLQPREEKDGSLGYEDALLMSVKRERDAERFYRDLAAQIGNPGLRKSILVLAEQEGRHANQLERELDDSLKEN